MTIAIVDQAASTRLRPRPGAKRDRRKASAHGPLARPVPSASPPRGPANEHFARGSTGILPPVSKGSVRACRVDPDTQTRTSWQLTDRGIAVVLALAAMIVLAAVTVIGLTAWRVTGPEYQASGMSQLSQR